MADKTKIGVIGLGSIAQIVHLPVLSKLPNVEIKAVSDIDKNKLKTLGDKYHLQNQYLDYKDMLNDADLDAVVVTTPTNTHHQVAVDSLNAGKHVLVEKPVARTFDEAKAIYSTSVDKEKVAMVGMNLRFRPDAMLLKSLISSGEMGDPFYIRCGWLRKQSSTQSWFMDKKTAGGGVIIDLGIALLDLATWFFALPELKTVSVQAYKHRTKNVEDSAVGIIRFENDKVINFEVSWSLFSEKDSLNMSVFGTEGTAHLNPLKAYKIAGGTHIDLAPTISTASKNMYKKSYENEIKHFIASINQNVAVVSSIEGALKRMKMLDFIYESVKQKKEIECN